MLKKNMENVMFVPNMESCVIYVEEKISNKRKGAKRKQEENAQKMLESSIKWFKPEIGDTVLVPIPDVDRAKIDRPQLTAVVLDNNEQTCVF